jgi:hypothetical protein
VSRTQDGTITADCNHQINIRQMLPIEFNSIDATKINLMMTQNAQQIVDTLFV